MQGGDGVGRVQWVVWAFLSALLFGGTTLAQPPAGTPRTPEWIACTGPGSGPPVTVIPACTTQIEAPGQTKPLMAVAFMYRGNANLALGNLAQAIADYDSALRLNPNYAKAHNNRGYAYAKLGRYEEALASYNRALAIDVTYTQAYLNRGGAYFQLGQNGRAIEDYTTVLGMDPSNAQARFNRGVANYRSHRFGDAIYDYDKVLVLTPGDKDAVANRALAVQAQNKAMAAAQAERDRAREADTAAAINLLAQALGGRGDAPPQPARAAPPAAAPAQLFGSYSGGSTGSGGNPASGVCTLGPGYCASVCECRTHPDKDRYRLCPRFEAAYSASRDNRELENKVCSGSLPKDL